MKGFSKNIIPRPYYLDKIKPFIGKNIIKVLTGQRRVGKSYLLLQVMEIIKKDDPTAHILYINKEDLAFSFLLSEEDLHTYVLENLKEQQTNYVFIDEIQEVKNFEKTLRSLQLRDNIDLYCTGSNANLLSGELSSLLSGRYMEITVYSLSFPEFLIFHKLEKNEESLGKYMKYGGLPYLIHLPLEEATAFEYLKNIYSTIVYRDIINRYEIRNTKFLEQLVRFLCSNTGSLFSAKKISDFLKSQRINMSPNQVQNYISYLASAFLIHRVERYDMVGKRIFGFGEKYYFENLGIRNGIWGYRVEDEGKIMENMVYNHLLYEGFEVKTGNMDNKEIDFVAQKNNEKLYLQVALTIREKKTLEREFGNLLKIDDNYPKKVITLEGFSGNTYKGIENIKLIDFLST